MESKTVKSGKINKNIQNVEFLCINCGKTLNFSIKDEIVIQGSEGIIAVNLPGAICPDCVHLVLDRVADPPGLICLNKLSSTLAEEIIGR
jgi:hypothetical protein